MVGRDFDLHRVNSENLSIKISESKKQDFSHIFRKKTTWEFLKLSAAVMGIEFAYSVETAFVSPILLELGIEHEKMTMVWALSPLLGLLFAPFLGSISDRCKSKIGRRRPLILFLSLGILLGLIFVPLGKDIGLLLGDSSNPLVMYNSTQYNDTTSLYLSDSVPNTSRHKLPVIAVIVTIFGTVLMDFDADVCQSPVRTYLLEVSIPEDHAKGLSIFTVMTGVGGFLGYIIGGIDWNALIIGTWLGGNVKTVFTIITAIFVLCIITTVTCFREIPLTVIENEDLQNRERKRLTVVPKMLNGTSNGKISETKCGTLPKDEEIGNTLEEGVKKNKMLTVSAYFKSIVSMPSSLKVLFVTNLLTWQSHLSYSLYFTDFVGGSVFEGDPTALPGTPELSLYNQGVRFGCWGLALYCFACAAYSTIIDRLIRKYRAKAVFIGGLLFYSIGMAILAIVKTKMAVLILSIPSGVAYSTLSTIPYLILAQYHTKGKFEEGDAKPIESSPAKQPKRGLGLDMAIIGSTIFIAQLSLSLGLGWLIQLAGSSTVVIWTAAILSLCAAISASQVTYLDL